jgi:hypothetical protein
VYGLFSGFAPHVAPVYVREFAAKLTSVSNAVIDPILHEVPRHWELSSEVADAVKDFLLDRAQFVGKNIEQWLSLRCNWTPTLPFPGLTR